MQGSSHAAPTPYLDLNAVLDDLTRSAAAILGGNFHAACLQGSFALGDFDQHSDVDFLIVINDDLSAAQLDALQAMHARLYDGPCVWTQHLEGSYIRRDVLRDHAAAGSDVWFLGHGSRSLVRSPHCNSVVVRCTVREHGICLAGPNPASLIDPIPVNALREEVFNTMRDWGGTGLLADPQRISSLWYQSFVVVSYCRMLRTLHTGKLGSKRADVRWALDQLDARWTGLIERAWSQRPDPALKCRQPVDTTELSETLAFVRYAIDLGQNGNHRPARRAVDPIIRAIARLQATLGRPVIVAIDGGSGAGKSTVAHAVQRATGAAIVTLDDFYNTRVPDHLWITLPVERRLSDVFDWERVRQQALILLRCGQPARWQAFDFLAGLRPDGTYALQSTFTEVAPAAVIVLEGAYSASAPLADLIDLAVLVDVPVQERHRRTSARDSADFLRAWHATWDEVERHYFNVVRPRQSFDLVVTNEPGEEKGSREKGADLSDGGS